MTDREAVSLLIDTSKKIRFDENGVEIDYRGVSIAERENYHAYELAISALRERMEREGGWISVEDRLPEKKGQYIVAFHPCYWDNVQDDICVGMDSFVGKKKWARNKYQRVTHWQPLPKPPKEDNNEQHT